MKPSHIPLLIAGILFIVIPSAYAGELRKYPSPDGMLNALVIPLPKAPYGSGESRIEMLSADGSLLFSQSYASEDGEHGYGVERAAWTPDSKFFVYSLSSSGGHQSWNFPTDFIAVSTLSIHRLDDYVGPITDPDFKTVSPDTVYAIGRGRADLEETTFEVRLSELGNGHPDEKKCTREEAIQAESEASKLYDWDSVYRSFTRFEHCDDGAISEGYSDSIGRLLAYHWNMIHKLHKLASSDKKFERFVIKHIDETIPYHEGELIIVNVQGHCPAKAKRLCELIERAACTVCGE